MVSAVLSCFIIINKRISIQPIEEHRIVSERRDSPHSETGLLIVIGRIVKFLEQFEKYPKLCRNVLVLRKLLYV